mmetsp:Transcript_28926/g.62856  ORF Transcript_28926/g.62856 Transcript_28926/m.62856 type:complete len:600 (+) Transcript_28926:770-2569(+)
MGIGGNVDDISGNSCVGDSACNAVGQNGGSVGSITSSSCVGSSACQNAALTNGSVGGISEGSCVGTEACYYAGSSSGSVGDISNSCVGDLACHSVASGNEKIVGNISNSCNIEHGCSLLGGSTDNDMNWCCNNVENQCHGLDTNAVIPLECTDAPGDQPPNVEACNNGIDDDGNGLIDCNDPVCFDNTFCTNLMGEFDFELSDDDDNDKLVATLPANSLGEGTATVSIRNSDCVPGTAPGGLTFDQTVVTVTDTNDPTEVELDVAVGSTLQATELPIVVDFNTLAFPDRSNLFQDEDGKEYWRSTFCVLAEHRDNIFDDPIAHTGSIVTIDYAVDPTYDSGFSIQGFSAIDADFDSAMTGNTEVEGFHCDSEGNPMSDDFHVTKNSLMDYCVKVVRDGFYVYDFRSVDFTNPVNNAVYKAIDDHVRHVLVTKVEHLNEFGKDSEGTILKLTLHLPTFIFDGMPGDPTDPTDVTVSGIVELAPYQGSLNVLPPPNRRLALEMSEVPITRAGVRLLQQSLARFSSVIQIDGSDATGGLSAGAYAGIAVGAAVAVVGVALVAVKMKKNRGSKKVITKEIEKPSRPGVYPKSAKVFVNSGERA